MGYNFLSGHFKTKKMWVIMRPINNGGDASLAFERMIFDKQIDHSKLRKQMLEYCKMDTLAMVKILGKLSELGFTTVLGK